MRRWLVALALAVIVVASSAAALRTPGPGPSIKRPSPRSAVLSLRRTPSLLSDVIATARLGNALDRVLQDPDLGTGRNDSCLIVSSSAGVLYERNPTRQLTPASTLKLLTATAAFRRLKPEGFTTTISSTAPLRGSGIDGDLVLSGGGDPLLGSSGYETSFPDRPARRFTSIEAVADAIVQKGVRRITGRVLGDDAAFDTQRYVPSWKPSYRATGNMGSLSALAYNDGFTSWRPDPFVVADDPAVYAAAALTAALRARGVSVGGDAARADNSKKLDVVARVPSLPLRDIVGEMLVHSDNETAELLTKAVGPPSTASGVAEVRKELAAAGYDVSGLAASDGSGLDPGDKATCSLLHAVLTGPSRQAILDAGLAVAGETGTLFDRFRGNPAGGRLKAKTGALEGVVGMAGVVEPKLTFAFIANGLPAPSNETGKRINERLGAALAAYPNAPAPESLVP